MACIGPATPGFLATLGATALLGLVSFGTPLFQSVFFLKAQIGSDVVRGTLTLGTLGFCVATPDNHIVCSKPSIGYDLDVNKLLDTDIGTDIPSVLVKWITYVLVLHIIGFSLSAISAIFGFLAHFPTFGMTCCSALVSGFASAIAMLAFIFDLVLFFLAKKGIEGIEGKGKAEMGAAIWLTLAAWLLLTVTGCLYACGRCCIPDMWEEEERARMERKRRDMEKGHHY